MSWFMVIGGLIGMALVALLALTVLDFVMPWLNDRAWERAVMERDGEAGGYTRT